MSFFGRMTSDDEVEALATELALLYIRKSDKVSSNPKELAHQFVEIQKEIYDELCAIR